MRNLDQILAPGATLDDYTITTLINRGAQAAVYQASQRGAGQAVALKLMHAGAYDDFSAGALRLKHEYNALLALKGLPLFLKPYTYKSTDDYAYIVMDWLEDAQDGEAFIKGNSPLIFETWLWIAKQLTTGLHECHKRQIIHRDIKPQNVLFDSDKTIKIIDFGIAQQDQYVNVTPSDINAGTLFYMPPEQIESGGYGIAGEMYALGVTLYEFIAGRVPFYADDPGTVMKKKRQADFIPPSRINPGIPEWVDALFVRMLAPEPQIRIQGAQEVLSLLSAGNQIPTDKIITLKACGECGQLLWKELPFCTCCGELYDLDISPGKYGVIAQQVQDPEQFLAHFDELTDFGLPKWRRPLFKTNYPHVLLSGISKGGATVLSDALSKDSNVMTVSAKPYQDMLGGMKINLVQLVLGGAAALSLVWGISLRKQTAMFSGANYFVFSLMVVVFLIVYTLMPLVPVAALRNLRHNRRWEILPKLRQLILRLTMKPLQQKASSLIKRSVMIFDKIDEMHLSGSIRNDLIKNLEHLTEKGLMRLHNMDKVSGALRQYRKEGIEKKITACEHSLRFNVSHKMRKQLIDKIGELTAARLKRQAVEQQYAENEIIFSHILSELNSIYVFIQVGDSDPLKCRFKNAVEQWG